MQTLIVKINGITRLTARADEIVFQDTPVGVWLRVQRYEDIGILILAISTHLCTVNRSINRSNDKLDTIISIMEKHDSQKETVNPSP